MTDLKRASLSIISTCFDQIKDQNPILMLNRQLEMHNVHLLDLLAIRRTI